MKRESMESEEYTVVSTGRLVRDPLTMVIIIITLVLFVLFMGLLAMLGRSNYVDARCKLYGYQFSLIDLDMKGHCCREPNAECVDLDALELGLLTPTPTVTVK